MRILYLTNGFPYPLTSGYLRHYYLIRELAAQHTITLLSIVGPGFREEHRAAMSPFTERVEVFASKGRGRSLPGKAAAKIAGLGREDASIRAMRAAIKRLLARETFDLVLFSGKPTYAAIEGLRLPPIVADFTDAASMRIRGQIEHAKPLKLPGLWVKYYQMRRLEQRILARADHLLFASTRDRDAVLADSRKPATVVPNGVDVDFWQRQSGQLGQDTIVITGSMNYRPNEDAALYLIDDILPRVQRDVPAAQVFVVGHSPTPALVEAGKRPNVTVTGFVDDVRPYLERASAFVAPLRFGAGIQNKVLEAMAMAVPVIASPIAADGLRTEDGDSPPLKVAQSADEFAALTTAALHTAAANPVPDAAARAYIEQHFVWRAGGEKLLAIVDAVTQGAPSS